LLPLEVAILGVAIDIRGEEKGEFHGYQAARLLKEREEAKMLTAHGTLYKALERLQVGGLLESRWEDPDTAANEERPRRRFYKITAAGETAWQEALRSAHLATAPGTPGLAPI